VRLKKIVRPFSKNIGIEGALVQPSRIDADVDEKSHSTASDCDYEGGEEKYYEDDGGENEEGTLKYSFLEKQAGNTTFLT
jgi:hypothetical protein